MNRGAAVTEVMTPPPAVEPRPGWMQSLSNGAPGIALLHIERARTGVAGWDLAHQWLAAVVAGGVTVGPQAGLYFGAPAAAFVLHAAAADRPGRYQRAFTALDAAVAGLVRQRLDHANARIDRGDLPATGEFDLISGLTGLGALLLRRHPDSHLCQEILTYLVRLTEPLQHRHRAVPGWWTYLSPHNRIDPQFPDGHANLGMAHGVTGPLALLALAARAGVHVDGHTAAMRTATTWLVDQRHPHDGGGAWWPQWVILDDRGHPGSSQTGPGRPSWCYGTPGIARALQLAGHALADDALVTTAEAAMTTCLSDPDQRARLVDPSLCHGHAGAFQTAFRLARGAHSATLAEPLATLARSLHDHRHGGNLGLLEGDAGAALALHTVRHGTPASGWDACMLLT